MPNIARLLLVVALPALAQTTLLNFRPVAAEYSAHYDRIIMVSGNPNRLRVFNPATGTDTAVDLQQPPLSLSVSPDGLFAAVGHATAISYVNLSVPRIERIYAVTTAASRLALAPHWIYNLQDSYYTRGYSVNIQSGAVTASNTVYAATAGRYNSARPAIYGTRDGNSTGIQRYEVANGPLEGYRDSLYQGSSCGVTGGSVWFSPDGSRIYTGCGTVLRASNHLETDMSFLSQLGDQTAAIGAFSESSASGTIATVRSAQSYYSQGEEDTFVWLYENQSFQQTGRIPLLPFTVSGQSFQSHGRWVFLNPAGTSLYAIVQAKTGSGLLNDFAFQRVGLGTPPDCGATFETTSTSASSLGDTLKVKVNASDTCAYKAVPDVSWVRVAAGGAWLGNTTFDIEVTANSGPSARTGKITMAGQTFTINQAAPTTVTGMTLLGHNVVDAEYNRTINRLILISSNPNALHVYNPTTKTETTIALSARPLSLSVRGDGKRATVGHDGKVSYVNLETSTVDNTFSVVSDVSRLVLAENGYAYLFPNQSGYAIYSLNIATGAVTTSSGSSYYSRFPRLHNNGRTLYLGGNSISKLDISQGTAKQVETNYYSGGTCGNLWLTRDGQRLIAACGSVVRTSDLLSEDLQLNGTFSDTTFPVVWADHSPERQETAVIPSKTISYSYAYPSPGDSYVQFYNDLILGLSGAVWFPSFEAGADRFGSIGRHVFWSSDGSKLYAVVQADRTGAPDALAVVEIASSSIATTVPITLQTVPAGLKVRVNDVLTSTPVTVNWVVSSRKTLAQESNQFANGSVYSFNSWNSGQYYSQPIVTSTTAATYTAFYTGTPCTYNISPGVMAVGLAGATTSVYVNTYGGCPVTVQSNASWITAGPLNGSWVPIKVAGFTGTSRTGTVTIASQTFSVTQQLSPPASLYSPIQGTILGSSPTFAWDQPADATNYRLDVGSTLGATDIFSGVIAGIATTVFGLPTDGRTLYVRLWTFAGGAWQTPRDYTFTACSGCAPSLAAITSPAAGSVLSSSTVTFNWTAISGATNYWLDVGLSKGQGDIYGAATTATSATVGSIPSGSVPIYVRLWTFIGGAWRVGPDVTFTSCASCNDPRAVLTAPAAGSTLTARTVTFQWTAGTGATQYWLDVGTSAGVGNLYGQTVTGLSASVTNLPTNGATLYVALWTFINGAWRAPLTYTVTACNACSAENRALLTAPAAGAVLTSRQVTFTWSAGTGATGYWLDVGNSVGNGSIAGRSVSGTSTSVTLPNDGRTLYVRLWTQIGGAWQTPLDYTMTACNGCTGSANAELTSPSPGAAFTSRTAVFEWTAGTNVAQYWLDVGTAPGVGNLFGAATTARSAQVINLPSSGATIYVSLWSHVNGAWQTPVNYTFQACNGCAADNRGLLSSPAPGTTLTSKNVTFTWTAGSGATNYWLDVGNSVGNGSISGRSSTQTSQTVALPNDGRTLFIRLWTYIGGTWQPPLDYTVTACNGC